MATIVGKYFPNGKSEIISYALPSETMFVHTDGNDGERNRSVLIKCPDNDMGAEIFDPKPLGLACTREEVEAECTSETLVESLRPGQAARIEMYDADDGPFTLVMQHCFTMSYN